MPQSSGSGAKPYLDALQQRQSNIDQAQRTYLGECGSSAAVKEATRAAAEATADASRRERLSEMTEAYRFNATAQARHCTDPSEIVLTAPPATDGRVFLDPVTFLDSFTIYGTMKNTCNYALTAEVEITIRDAVGNILHQPKRSVPMPPGSERRWSVGVPATANASFTACQTAKREDCAKLLINGREPSHQFSN